MCFQKFLLLSLQTFESSLVGCTDILIIYFNIFNVSSDLVNNHKNKNCNIYNCFTPRAAIFNTYQNKIFIRVYVRSNKN